MVQIIIKFLTVNKQAVFKSNQNIKTNTLFKCKYKPTTKRKK